MKDSVHNFLDEIPALAQELTRFDTLDIPMRQNGLYSASGRQAADAASGYQHAWVRDNVMVAYSRWRCGNSSSALRTVKRLEAFLTTQMDRMAAIVAQPGLKEQVEKRPHARFDVTSLEEIAGNWAHAQNDALGYAVWLRLCLTEHEALTAEECELFDLTTRYFAAIEYWTDRDSGAWEETRRTNASSIGAVLASLLAIRRYRQSAGSFGQVSDEDLNRWIEHGRLALRGSLPFESPPARKTDAALLFLIHPLSIVEDRRTEDLVLSLVRARLMGPIGIRRYMGDSYFCQDYDEWLPPSERTMDFSQRIEVRDALLQPGCEAQWCLFDPILSTIYGTRFQQDPARTEWLEAQVRHFRRSLKQLTPDGQCPELYYLKGGEWRTNDHVPLAWTQANLAVAWHSLKESAGIAAAR